jgi:ribosome-associated translation inhibitor RaiA
MTVTVRGRHLDLSVPLRTYAERRVRSASDAFERRIERSDIAIGDVNGPRGGVDKICAVAVTLKSGGSLLVRAADADAYAAVDRAASRVRTVLARRFGLRVAARRSGRRLQA